MWTETSSADNTYAYTKTTATPLCIPSMALIDTIAPTLTRGFHADTLLPLTDVFDTICISDNCANVTWKYIVSRGAGRRSTRETRTAARLPA